MSDEAPVLDGPAVARAWTDALALWDVSVTLSPPVGVAGKGKSHRQGEEPLAYIDLVTRQVVVNLPLLEKLGAAKSLTAVLAHEIGHHVRFPHSLAVAASLQLLEKRLIPGLAQSLTNLFFDLLVNEFVGRTRADELARVYQGFVKDTKEPIPLFCFYLAVYAFMTLGAFAVVIALGRRGEPNEDLADWAGVGFRHPVLGLSMVVFMLSLAGIPPTAGFVGKFYLFSAAIDAGWTSLAVIGVLNSVVSVYYYFGVLVAMYMAEGTRAIVPPSSRPYLLATILVTVAATIVIGVLPAEPMRLAERAFVSLR